MAEFATGHCGTEGKQSPGGHCRILGQNDGNTLYLKLIRLYYQLYLQEPCQIRIVVTIR